MLPNQDPRPLLLKPPEGHGGSLRIGSVQEIYGKCYQHHDVTALVEGGSKKKGEARDGQDIVHGSYKGGSFVVRS